MKIKFFHNYCYFRKFASILSISKLIVPASITAHQFYYNLGYRYKDGKKELNDDDMYIIEKFLQNFVCEIVYFVYYFYFLCFLYNQAPPPPSNPNVKIPATAFEFS